MKKIIFLLFLTLPFSILAQSFSYENTVERLNDWIEISNDEAKLEYVNKLKDKLADGCMFQFFNLKEFYVIDIDRDGLKDIVYSGECMLDGGHTAIYRYNGVEFEELISVIGYIYQVSEFNSDLPFSFTLRNHACCGGFTNVFEKYVLVLENRNYKFKLQSREDYPFDVEFPDSYFKKPIAFKTTKEKYNLRLSPVVDNETEMDRPYEAYGNIICSYPENSFGYAIAEKTDETGRIWWFVKMNNKTAKGLEYTSDVGDNNKEPTYSLGWISSRYVEKVF